VDDHTKELLRRRGEHTVIDDVDRLYGVAAVEGARRRRRRRVVTIAVCVLFLVVGTAVVVASNQSSSPTRVDVPPAGQVENAADLGVQFRPVLAPVPPSAQEDASAAPVVAGCDASAVMSLGASAPSTPRSQLGEGGCAIVKDVSGARFLLGPVALDGTSIRTATKSNQSGSGWGVDLQLTKRGSAAFDALANAQFHKQFGVMADGDLVVMPTVQPSDAQFTPFAGPVRISVGDERAADSLVRSVPKKPEPGAALAKTGSADCTKAAKPGWDVTFAAQVTGGHTICVTRQGNDVASYFDGKPGGLASGNAISTFGGIGTIDGRLVVFGNIPTLPTNAGTVLLTFCKGPSLLVRPLNQEQTQYVAATIDYQKFGSASVQYADDAGMALTLDQPRRSACQRNSAKSATGSQPEPP
jgi:hypothetical protein